jgi:hypothetical protein
MQAVFLWLNPLPGGRFPLSILKKLDLKFPHLKAYFILPIFVCIFAIKHTGAL